MNEADWFEVVRPVKATNDYIDDSAIKLRDGIEIFLGAVKSAIEALETNKHPKVFDLQKKVKEYKEKYYDLYNTATKLTKPIERRLEKLKEQLKKQECTKLSEESIEALKEMHLIFDRSKIDTIQDQISEINSNRESKFTNLNSNWDEIKIQMSKLTDKLNWYKYCVETFQKEKKIPSPDEFKEGKFNSEELFPFMND